MDCHVLLKMAPANTGVAPRHALQGDLVKPHLKCGEQQLTSIGNRLCLTQEKACQGLNFKSLLINFLKTHVNQLSQTWFSQIKVGKTFKIMCSSHQPASPQSSPKPIPSVTSRWLLSTSRDDDSTSSLGNLFQCLTTLTEKEPFLTWNLNLSWHNLRPLLHILSPETWQKRPTPISLQPPSSCWDRKVPWASFCPD